MRTKFTLLAILLLTFFTVSTFTQTNVSGFISGNTNWTLAGSPYIITGNTILDNGIVLTIDPGVIVKFNSAKSLQINGILRAIGNSLNRITFTSNQPTPTPGDWGYILFSDNSNDYNYTLLSGSIMEYCLIEYAGENSANLTVAGSIRISASFPYIHNCEVRNNSTSGIIFYNDPNSTGPTTDVIKISNCYIHNNNSTLNLNSDAGGIDITANLSHTVIDSNVISNNKARYGGGITCNIANNTTSIIKNNSIIGNSAELSGGGMYMNAAAGDFSYNLIYGNSAYDGAGIYENAVSQFRTINNNLVVNNTSTKDAVFVKTGCAFIKNTIVDNTASSSIITIWGGTTNSTTNNNTITRNKLTGASSKAVSITSPTVFKNNNIYRNTGNYEVYTSVLQSTPSLNVENCWWNTTVSNDINTKIYDFLDNNTLSIVDYSPFANTPDTAASMTPPINVIKTDLGGGKIKITWDANMEVDFAGYKIYWGSPTGYSFTNFLNVGNVTTGTITGVLITDTIAVTAYDAHMDGTNDQFEGHESWFTCAIGKPSGAFTATPVSVCPGDIVNFTANTLELYPYANTAWTWSFPNGTPAISTANNPKIIYNTPGVYSVKLKVANIAGSDSLTYNNYITVKSPSYATISPKVCNFGFYVSPSGKNTWYSNGTYYDTIPNHTGCDSILTIHLLFSHNSQASISTNACKRYVSPSGTHIWTNSGTYTDTIPNYQGCDSIITIQLIVQKIDTSITVIDHTLTSNASGATYQWLNCNTTFSEISGENHQSYTPGTNGNFAVVVTQNTCADTSSCYQVIVTGIDDNNQNQAYSFYPNPASNIIYLNIDGISNTNLTVNIYNIFGVLVRSELLQQNQQKINIGDLKKGIYMVEIKSKEWSKKQKLIIQN